jgi:NAD(P)-dependent dehydrogenase (short-subunit alcohol dehydrogenase family)
MGEDWPIDEGGTMASRAQRTTGVVVITGASAGIGRACARRLHDEGWTVVGASRRTSPADPWAQLAVDVDDDESVAAGIARVVAEHGGIDAVVTCAGWGLAGPVETTPLAEAAAQMETNFFGTVRTVAAALPSLRQRHGRIIVLSSIGGLIGLPFQAYYSASKFALEGWAEALAWEVRPFDVDVTLVEPGNFRTDFTASRRTATTGEDDPYRAAQAKAIGTMEADEQGGAGPERVADVVARLLVARRPPRRLTVGPTGERLGAFVKRLLPNRVFEAASASSLGV